MKSFINKIVLLGLAVLSFAALTGCNPEEDETIYAKIQAVGPEYVDVYVNGPNSVQLAYVVRDSEQVTPPAPVILFNSGTNATVKGGSTFRIAKGLKQSTQYYLYLAARIDGMNYYEVCLPFTTTEYQETGELLTVVSKDYNSYLMRISLPAETKMRGNAIRFNQSDIMMYNYMRPDRDDYSALLYNAGNFATKDTTVVYSEEENWYETGTDSDGDGKIDLDTYYNPISPGEPIVYVAGKFEWMEEPDGLDPDKNHVVNGFFYPSGWDPGYYLPCIDSTKYWSLIRPRAAVKSGDFITDVDMTSPYDDCWTGARDRVLFKLADPAPLDAKVNVQLVDATPIDLTLHLIPEDGVAMYAFGIFDDTIYKQMLDLCEGREEWLKWAVTSYFAAYTFGTKAAEGPVEAKLTSFYYQSAITEDTDYHVLITAMGDETGSSQSFTQYKFRTTKKVMDEPEMKVTALENTHPYVASFNVKCTSYIDNPVIEAYYSADYVCNWLLNINAGKTYFSLTSGNYMFTADELEKINSDEGLDISIPTVDGQTMRFVTVGYNREYTPNDLNFKNILDCPAVADYEAPYVKPATYVDGKHYLDLAGDWTATAELLNPKDTTYFTHTSKISLLKDLYDYPETLSQEVYDLYANTGKKGKTKEEVDAMWQEFTMAAKEFTEERLEYQNRLLGLGWMDKDSYKRLTARTPYDLFIAKDYSSVDVASLYFDFGPKWFLETKIGDDGKPQYTIPMDSRLLPPGANWSAVFQLSGMEMEGYKTVTYGDGWTPRFPVTVSEDRNTVTIHPLDYEGTLFYPQMLGIDYSMGQTIMEYPVVSDIVLTRGWTEPEIPEVPEVKSVSSMKAESLQVDVDFPKVVYKSRTGFPEVKEFKKIEYKPVTMEEFRKRADELVQKRYNKTR